MFITTKRYYDDLATLWIALIGHLYMAVPRNILTKDKQNVLIPPNCYKELIKVENVEWVLCLPVEFQLVPVKVRDVIHKTLLGHCGPKCQETFEDRISVSMSNGFSTLMPIQIYKYRTNGFRDSYFYFVTLKQGSICFDDKTITCKFDRTARSFEEVIEDFKRSVSKIDNNLSYK